MTYKTDVHTFSSGVFPDKNSDDWYWYTLKSNGIAGNSNIVAHANSKNPDEIEDDLTDIPGYTRTQWEDIEIIAVE